MFDASVTRPFVNSRTPMRTRIIIRTGRGKAGLARKLGHDGSRDLAKKYLVVIFGKRPRSEFVRSFEACFAIHSWDACQGPTTKGDEKDNGAGISCRWSRQVVNPECVFSYFKAQIQDTNGSSRIHLQMVEHTNGTNSCSGRADWLPIDLYYVLRALKVQRQLTRKHFVPTDSWQFRFLFSPAFA